MIAEASQEQPAFVEQALNSSRTDSEQEEQQIVEQQDVEMPLAVDSEEDLPPMAEDSPSDNEEVE